MNKDFFEKSSGFFNKLGSSKLMVLATSNDDKVTARMMSCVIIENAIYFQTDKTSEKFMQMTANPNVALCTDNIQIEGTAAPLGHTLSSECKFFAQAYKKHHKGSFKRYSSMPNTTVIKIVPTKITLWEYEDFGKKVYRLIIDMENQTAEKEYYIT